MKGTNKEVAAVIRQATDQGWDVGRTKRHIRFTNPDGETYVAAQTPSDWRGVRNLVAALRRLGFVDRRRPPKKLHPKEG